MARRWKPSKQAAKEFAVKMREIDAFCERNEIKQSSSSDSYYFEIAGTFYRVSNHSVEASNRGAFDEFGNQKRELYHDGGRRKDVVYIHAGKTRIMDIYNDLKAGYELDGRGNRMEEKQ